MEVALEAEFYSPKVDTEGNFCDKIPNSHQLQNGIRCPCSRKVYNSYNTFSSHVKTKMHQSWILELNHNKQNFFVENQHLKETVKNQQLIIQRLEIECQNKNLMIDSLTKQLHGSENEVQITHDLIDFD